MSSSLLPRRVEPSSSTINNLNNVHGNTLTRRAGLLEGWDAGLFDSLKFSHGLTGVDQDGNFLWVDVFLTILGVIGFTLLAMRISHMVWKHMRHLTAMGHPEKQTYWAENRSTVWPWIYRHIMMAPLHKLKHNSGFQISSAIDNGTLPGRLHFIMLVIYGALNVAWCLALPWKEESGAIIAALRGRSGTLAALNLIPTILFALRSNPLISLLQVSYDDFNLFHRWGGRITIVESIIHTACWLANTNRGGGFAAIAKGLTTEASYGWGMVGTVAFTIILLQSPSPIRHAFYETFINIHRLMIWFALIGVYLHLKRHNLPQIPWMYLIFIFYGGELAMRGLYIAYYGFNFNRTSRVKVEALPGEACRVTIDLVRDWHPKPGCHVHIYMPALALWSSHPFSVAWADTSSSLSPKALTEAALESGAPSPHAAPTSRQISLVCRARTGFTRKMYERACQSPSGSAFETLGFIEGPYGGHHSLDSFGTAVLFAGGVGITHQVMYVKHLVEGAYRGTTATRRVLLCWTIPDAQSLEWVRPWMDEILRLPGRKQVLRIKLFISRPKGPIQNRAGDSVVMYAGRCNAATEIENEFKNRVGAMAVTVCGSGGMADSVRAATRTWVEDGSVEFIEEAFTF